MSTEPRNQVDGPPRADDAVPERVRIRPLVSDWSDTELITLPEVVALFWPGGDGPVTLATIRTAVRDGDLSIAKIAGKFFTTKAAVIRMTTPRPHPSPLSAAPPSNPTRLPAEPAPAGPGTDPILERIRARRERAKSRH